MEFCPKPNLQVRYRREPFSIAESLRVGVQVAAAVETAHRAGVLHRDIKPANILVTEYNRPALTDFGIASTTNAAAESAGLSIPWSPPESFADVPRSDPRSDVYQLGATVYSLLAGRSPFELAGQRNSAAELIERIERMPLPALDRADAPASLERVLERAMAKAPTDRYESALAFARALQKVQIELSHSVTPIDILDDAIVDDETADDDDGLTRVRGVVSIDPETDPAAGLTRPSASATGMPSFGPPAGSDDTYLPPMDTVVRGSAQPVTTADLDETVIRSTAPPATSGAVSDAADRPRQALTDPEPPRDPDRSRRGFWVGLTAGILGLVVVVIIAVSLPGLLGGGPAATPTPETSSDPQDPVSAIVPEPTDVAAVATADGIRFTWTNPDPKDGDYYLYAIVTNTAEPAFDSVRQAEVTVPADPSGTTCIDVVTVRANGQSSDPPVRGCTP
jgi:hypothetical protein